MKAFVIGATGYIGAHVSARLAEAGWQVTGLARNTQGEARILAAGHAVVVGSIDQCDRLVDIARAHEVTIFAPQLSPEQEFDTVAALLEGLAGSERKFLFTSGTGVIGQRTVGGWCEDSFGEFDDAPVSRLVARRAEVEALVRDAVGQGVAGIVMRPSAVWGDGSHPIAERMLASYEKTGAICYIGDGMNCYSSVNVHDLADLYLAACARGVAGALYHASSGEVNNRCIAELLASRLACPTRSVDMDEAIEIWGKFAALIVLSVSSRTRCPRARQELGWTPHRTSVVDEILSGALRPG